MIAATGRRLQGATAFSFSAHVVLFGLYFGLKAAQPKAEPVLHDVDFIDLRPVAAVPPSPAPAAQTPPRGLSDFLKLALPKFKDSGPQEAPSVPKDAMQLPNLPATERLVGKADPLQRAAVVKLDATLNRMSAADMTELARQQPTARDPSAMAALDAPKTISLDAVGRRSVGSTGPAIRIEGAAPARSTMRDLPAVPRGAPGGGGTSTTVGAIGSLELKEGAPARGGGGKGFPGGSPSIGYSQGSGISLAERPAAARPAAALPAAAPAPERAKEKELAQAASDNKAVSISGPLAGRKVVAMSLPSYPEWARAKGVETDVVIRFFVSPEGAVLPRMFLERASGYKELDDACKEALSKIVFAPLSGGSKEEQWGVITFRFRLR